MNIQHIQYLMASVKCFVENTLNKENCFTNSSGFFYPITDNWNNYYVYALPYQPVLSDASIPNATIMSGVYLSGVYITTGVSGLVDFNYERGWTYFSSPVANPQTQLSGNYAISDFNVKLTSEPEETLLFETKYSIKPKTQQTLTGIPSYSHTFPVIYLKSFGGRTDPFAFGGTDKEITNIRMIVLADSQFHCDGVGSIFKDKVRTLIPLLTGVAEMPYNSLGGYANTSYNYGTLTTGRNHSDDSIWIENVDVSSLPGSAYSEVKKLNPHAFVSLVDMEVHSFRNPRL